MWLTLQGRGVLLYAQALRVTNGAEKLRWLRSKWQPEVASNMSCNLILLVAAKIAANLAAFWHFHSPGPHLLSSSRHLSLSVYLCTASFCSFFLLCGQNCGQIGRCHWHLSSTHPGLACFQVLATCHFMSTCVLPHFVLSFYYVRWVSKSCAEVVESGRDPLTAPFPPAESSSSMCASYFPMKAWFSLIQYENRTSRIVLHPPRSPVFSESTPTVSHCRMRPSVFLIICIRSTRKMCLFCKFC